MEWRRHHVVGCPDGLQRFDAVEVLGGEGRQVAASNSVLHVLQLAHHFCSPLAEEGLACVPRTSEERLGAEEITPDQVKPDAGRIIGTFTCIQHGKTHMAEETVQKCIAAVQKTC